MATQSSRVTPSIGNEGDDVGGAEAGMGAGMFRQINEFGGFADAADGGFGNIDGIAYQSDNTAVMVGIHLAVKKIDAVHLHGFENGVNFGFVAAFGEIGDTFDECWHKF